MKRLSRHLEEAVLMALRDTRIVLLSGARQAGKSTLARKIAAARKAEWRSLDDGKMLAAARADPSRFVRTDTLMVIDEIQRALELILPIKHAVDAEQRAGQFLLTGSARLLGMKALPDSLVGRIETLELWPLSQGELEGKRERFIDALFDDEPRFKGGTTPREELIERLVRGGFPEAVSRDEARRRKFFDAYANDLVDRDISQLADISRRDALHTLLRSAAQLPAHLLKVERLSARSGIPARSVERYLTLFEHIFLLKRIPAWSNQATTRTVHMSKVLWVDTGLCARLQERSLKRLLRDDAAVGPLVENFVLGELGRQCGWSRHAPSMMHYRTHDGFEVDAVLRGGDGELVGVEVKATESLRAEDFAGLRHFAARAGAEFHHGVVLYAGDAVLPFGPRLTAVPIDALWSTP